MAATIEIIATGDLGPCREDPLSIFAKVRDRLNQADIVLGQLEPVLTDRGSPSPQARLAMRSLPATATALRAAGFDVISFASNHCLDWGTEGLLDTCASLRDAQLAVVGAGENISAARAPVIVDREGTRVAFVAYNSILPMGYWAESNRAGCAPLRGWTHYEQIEHDQPGTPSRVLSFADGEDKAAMMADIAQAKQSADVVIVSIHWGIHFVPALIADYQREVAHAAIDAGADAVIGHHPHVLKAVEVYRNKTIFYSLGNFAIDPPTSFQSNLTASKSHQEVVALNPTWEGDDKKLILPESCKTLAARIVIEGKEVKSVEGLPIYINDDSQPEFLTQSDSRFAEIVEYLDAITRSQQIATRFSGHASGLSMHSSEFDRSPYR
jgi:poly-gamma-glutamate capsule biosynthesis protein CapA/YwtB (metallophosphatase superfamily)